jgi:hypothetical protein
MDQPVAASPVMDEPMTASPVMDEPMAASSVMDELAGTESIRSNQVCDLEIQVYPFQPGQVSATWKYKSTHSNQVSATWKYKSIHYLRWCSISGTTISASPLHPHPPWDESGLHGV